MKRLSVLLVALLVSALSVPALASAQVVLDGALPEPSTDLVAHAVAELPPPVAPAPTRAEVRAMLAARRAAHIAELQRYVDAGVFPVNDVQPGYLNVFMDPSGNLCAVANLMAFDGARAMVESTAATTNYIRLVDVHEGALYAWILSSGFTQEEIGQIQEPYFFQEAQLDRREQERQLNRERRRLQHALGRTLARLRHHTDRSLDVAVDRLLGTPTLAS